MQEGNCQVVEVAFHSAPPQDSGAEEEGRGLEEGDLGVDQGGHCRVPAELGAGCHT